MRSGKVLGNAETSFIDRVRDLVNFGSKDVVHDDRNSRVTNTKGRVDKGLRDTVRQSYGVRVTCSRKSREGLDHTYYRSKKGDKSRYRSQGGNDHQVLFKHRKFEGCSF